MWILIMIIWTALGFPLGVYVGAHIRKWGE